MRNFHMNSSINIVPTHKKKELKKIMGKIDETGTAIIVNPTREREAELVMEKYYFNQDMSSNDYPDSCPIMNIQRQKEAVMITTLGKTNKNVVQNIATAYYSSGKYKSFFIPVDIDFDHYYSKKHIYLFNGKQVVEFTNISGLQVISAVLGTDNVYLVTECGKFYVTDHMKKEITEVELNKVNTVNLHTDNTLVLGTKNGVYIGNGNEVKELKRIEIPELDDVYDVLHHEDILILTDNQKKVKSFAKDKDFSLLHSFNFPEERKISIKGISDFFGGVLAVSAGDDNLIDTIKFLTLPELKILKHARHAQI